jgi:mannosyl-3-phosphoglycerate phosphatase
VTSASAVLFTDLDGTLLDHETYQPGLALEALTALRRAGVPVIVCSAKTRAEQQVVQQDLGIEGLFVVENGAAIFSRGPEGISLIVEFGMSYDEVRSRLLAASAEAAIPVRGYGDMTVDEVMRRTGLDRPGASRAMAREYSETFVRKEESEESVSGLRAACRDVGLRLARGARFWTALGDHDKGTAVRYALGRLWANDPPPTSYAIGDYLNDETMLAAVDIPMLVQRPDETWADLDLDGLVRLRGVGPNGWLAGARRVLADLSESSSATGFKR